MVLLIKVSIIHPKPCEHQKTFSTTPTTKHRIFCKTAFRVSYDALLCYNQSRCFYEK